MIFEFSVCQQSLTAMRFHFSPYPLFNVEGDSQSSLDSHAHAHPTLKRGSEGKFDHFDFNFLLPSAAFLFVVFCKVSA